MEEGGDAQTEESHASPSAQPANGPDALAHGDHDRIYEDPILGVSDSDNDEAALDIPMETEEDEITVPAASAGDHAAFVAPDAASDNGTAAGLDGQSRKRKLPNSSSDHDDPDDASGLESHKKVKLADDAVQSPEPAVPRKQSWSSLPPELWHHIFTYCPPKTLANLLRVNKLFNLYLDHSSSFQSSLIPPLSPPKSVVGPLAPNAIWRASRRRFWPKMPTPLRSKTELEMWRLALAVRCDNCNKLGVRNLNLPAEDLWHAGPGPDGVALVWPFASALCGSCLLLKAVKEIDLLFSSSVPSTVIPALPFVFLTQEFHLVAAGTVEGEQPPGDLKVTKIFLSADVAVIQAELETVNKMGPGAAEEWLKGLESRRSSLLHEAAKWQRWEATQEPALIRTDRNEPHPSSDLATAAGAQHDVISGIDGLPSVPDGVGSTASQTARHPRSQQEAALLKSARAAEIERRCQLLTEPILPNVLRHIPAFQAAIQITTPLDDCAWDVLKPRLLSQRLEAEARGQSTPNDVLARDEEMGDEPRKLESTLATTKGARDLIDKQWEEVQEPLRARIVGYADEFVKDSWDGGRKVTRENCSRFAAEAFLYIRKRFYADIAVDIAAAKAAGKPLPSDPPQGPFTQKLTLENMKWIFDSKIKPFTESHRKELFFCNACEGNAKAYGFEGVVQHYAAKHTSALSLGSIVVHWRAEWPETPPFNPEGRCRKSSAPPSTSRNQQGYHGFQAMPSHMPPYPPHTAPVYGAPGYSDQYHPPAQPQSQYPPQAPYPSANGYGPPLYPAHPVPYPPYQQNPVHNGVYPPPPLPIGPDPSQPYHSAYAPSPPGVTTGPGATPAQGGPYGYNYNLYQGNNQVPFSATPASGFSSQYPAQLEFVAKNSREVWQALGSVKDLPGSARVFVTIHHVVKRYRSRFSETPSLSMFIDGLSNNKDMRPVRNINGLSCKACELGLGNSRLIEREAQSVSFPKLANHFQSKHIELVQQMTPHLSPLDWVHDMVSLGDPLSISHLRSTVASDSQKYYLLSDAFPDVFAQPPQAPVPYQQPQHGTNVSQPQDTGDSPLPPSVDNHDRFYGSSIGHSGMDGRSLGEGPSHHSSSHQAPPQRSYEPQAPTSRQEPNRHKPSHQNSKRGGGKNKNKNSKAPEAVRRRVEDEKIAEEARREEDEIRAMWATDRAVAARAVASSAAPSVAPSAVPSAAPSAAPSVHAEADRAGHLAPMNRGSQHITSRTNTPQYLRREASQRATPRPIPCDDGPSLMDALEMHLGQGHTSEAVSSMRRPESTMQHSRSIHSSHPSEQQRSVIPSGSGHYPKDRNRSGSPAYVERHWRAPQDSEYREPRGVGGIAPQAPGTYNPPPAASYEESNEPRFERRVDIDAGPHHHWESPRLGEPAFAPSYERYPPDRRGWREDLHAERIPPPPLESPTHDRTTRPEYYRQSEDMRPSYGAIQEYEIVQVIDDQGEYYIRRPIHRRREAAPTYYEERGAARRESEPYPRYEPIYGRRPPVAPLAEYEVMPSQTSRDERQPPATRRDSHAAPPVDRADPAYYEPYDPHNPTAAAPAVRPQYRRQQVYYGD